MVQANRDALTGAGRDAVLISDADADGLGIAAGDAVRLRSPYGALDCTDGNLPADQVDQSNASKIAVVAKDASLKTYVIRMNNTKPPFDNINARMCFAHAFNYMGFITDILSGYATRNPQPMPNNLWGLDRIDQYAFYDGRTDGNYTWSNDGTGIRIYMIDTGIWDDPYAYDGTYANSTEWGDRRWATPGVIVDGQLVTTDLKALNIGIEEFVEIKYLCVGGIQ